MIQQFMPDFLVITGSRPEIENDLKTLPFRGKIIVSSEASLGFHMPQQVILTDSDSIHFVRKSGHLSQIYDIPEFSFLVLLKLFAASYEEPSLRARRSQCARGDSIPENTFPLQKQNTYSSRTPNPCLTISISSPVQSTIVDASFLPKPPSMTVSVKSRYFS